jgi:ribosomal protein S14
MKNQIIKDKKKRTSNFYNENKLFVLKNISKNTNLPKYVRWNSCLKFTTLSKFVYITNTVNRCVVTGRKKKINPNFKISRLSFLRFARNGFICGLTKSSW